MEQMHELQSSVEIAPFDVIEYEKLLDSSDMDHTDHLRIARDIAKHYDAYDGFLIAHGTDTMHYTASALSFLLNNLAKPVVVTGAMVPLAEPFNDARRNLIIGMMIASNPKICEVCVFFNDSLFRGNRCDKVSHSYAAFKTINYPALGVIEASRFVLRERLLLSQPTGGMSILSDLSGRVMHFDLHPEADVDTLLVLLSKKVLDGIVLSVNGVGHLKGVVAAKARAISRTAAAHNVVVSVVIRELRGCLARKEAERIRHLEYGALAYVGDMCASTAQVKMAYLFGKGLSPTEVARQMPLNLRGEVTPIPAAPGSKM
ncbi:L-asparaginase [Strigomonas culicis]|nr:L-asparaginase [Strigomonas culicis]|eukprot:EPY32654.1 L-asparaginase [Strigomonas culicis]